MLVGFYKNRLSFFYLFIMKEFLMVLFWLVKLFRENRLPWLL